MSIVQPLFNSEGDEEVAMEFCAKPGCGLGRDELAHDPEYHEYHPFWGDGDYIDILFDGPPSHESGRFVEVESPAGKSVRFGEWVQDGVYWRLRFPSERAIIAASRLSAIAPGADVEAARQAVIDLASGYTDPEHTEAVDILIASVRASAASAIAPSAGREQEPHAELTINPRLHLLTCASCHAAAHIALAEMTPLLEAAQGFDAIIQILDSGQSLLPFGTEGEHYDAAYARFSAALAPFDHAPVQPLEGGEK